MNFGPQTTEDDSFAIMDKAIDLGINFFDTADVYGWKKGEGVTEQIIGKWFAQGSGRREQTIVATKVFGDMDFDPKDVSLRRGLSAVKIRRACENSLLRMKTDYIDLYQMHHVAREMPWEECWQAFDVLVKQGKVIYVGSSNFAGWHIAAANESAKSRHFLGLVSEQSKYSLFSRAIELEVLPACLHYGIGVIPWSPLESGLLGGALEKATAGRRPPSRFKSESKPSDPGWKRGKASAKRSARSRPMSHSPGCCITRPLPRPSSGLAPSNN